MSFLEAMQEAFGEARVRQEEAMHEHTTFKIGGPAEFYIDVDKLEDLTKAVGLARQYKQPVFIFGAGTHIIVSEKGIQGLVVKNNCRKFEVARVSGRIKNQKLDVDKAFVYAESGTIMNQLVRFTIDQGYAGLEHQLGLPGTVGGAIYTNAYYEYENSFVSNSLYMAKILTSSGEIKDVESSYFLFDKEKTVIQKSGDIVLSVIFSLLPEEKDALWEKGMKAMQTRQESMAFGNVVGLTFRNVFLSQALKTATQYKNYSFEYLLAHTGLLEKQVGGVKLSEKKPTFVLNMGNATPNDVQALYKVIKQQFYDTFGILLRIHVTIIGR